MRTWFSLFAGTAAALAVVLCPLSISGQAKGKAKDAGAKNVYKVPRMADGAPDLQGTWFTNSGAAAWDIEEHGGGLGVQAGPSIITDTPDKKIPYQAWALEHRKDLILNHAYDDPQAHCYASGVPRVNYAPFGLQIYQGRGLVTFTFENFHLFRLVPTTPMPHVRPAAKLFMGDSRGHWEGDTLVIDVTNQNGRTWLDMASNFTSDGLHVVERFRRVDENTIAYEAKMTDPKVYTRPWTMAFTLRRNPDPNYELMELACWEGERDLVHYPEDQGAPKK
ncbi:MAG: hypothetical protein ABI811_21740 [Acidobacteriota bacterium]